MPSGRARKKRFFAIISLRALGSCVVLHVASSSGVRVLSISESRSASHSASLVHTSSIWLSPHSCPMVNSPVTEGKSHPFGAAWAIPLWRVFHVAWWATVMVSLCPK